MYTMVFIYTKQYDSNKKEWTEQSSYSLGFAETESSTMTANEYCNMCLESNPLSNPVIATLPEAPKSQEEWDIVTREINKRYLDIARTKEFLQSLLPPFNEPYNLSQDF